MLRSSLTVLQEFGTPVQDALRRDATINALFYNIHTRSVEDMTERVRTSLVCMIPTDSLSQGIPDLHAGRIRTPLPARQTFLDDPLRVLRCIRFAAKFGFEIDADVRKHASEPEIKASHRSQRVMVVQSDSVL